MEKKTTKRNKIKKILIAFVIILVLSVAGYFIINGRFRLEKKYYNKGEYIDITLDEMNNLLDEKESFLLFTYNSYCNLSVPCEYIFQDVMDEYKIDILQLPFVEFKKSSLYETIKYAPSLIIIKNGKVVDYLKADSDEDLPRYQDPKVFEEWLFTYIKQRK